MLLKHMLMAAVAEIGSAESNKDLSLQCAPVAQGARVPKGGC